MPVAGRTQIIVLFLLFGSRLVMFTELRDPGEKVVGHDKHMYLFIYKASTLNLYSTGFYCKSLEFVLSLKELQHPVTCKNKLIWSIIYHYLFIHNSLFEYVSVFLSPAAKVEDCADPNMTWWRWMYSILSSVKPCDELVSSCVKWWLDVKFTCC